LNSAKRKIVPLWEEKKFDLLKIRFDDQVSLLRKLTDIDLQVFGGYLTISLAFASWVTQQAPKESGSILGLALISGVIAVSATVLLLFNAKRRVEVVGTVKNLNLALGYDVVGAYIEDKKLNADTKFRPWKNVFFFCIWTVYAGILLVLFRANIFLPLQL
jgi:hypothetical protein